MFIVLNTRSISLRKVLLYLCIMFFILLFGLASIWVYKNVSFSNQYIPKGVKVEGIPFGGLNKGEASTKLLELSKVMTKWPMNAFYEADCLKEGKEGRFIAINQTLEKMHKAPINSNVSPVYYPILQERTINDLKAIKYGKGTDKEVHFLSDIELSQLKTISKDLFNKIIYPGEVFSLADFGQSHIINFQEYNSNVSQLLARTLYNTAKKANLKIEEEWVIYQPKLGSIYNENIEFQPGKDLKFRNNSSSPLLIRGEVNNESLKLWLLGS